MEITEEQVIKYLADHATAKVRLYNKGWTLAQAEVHLPGQVIRGCTVRKSDYPHEVFGENVWIEPPCYRSKKGNFSKITYFEEMLWKAIEKKIFEAYKEKAKDTFDPKDIPF